MRGHDPVLAGHDQSSNFLVDRIEMRERTIAMNITRRNGAVGGMSRLCQRLDEHLEPLAAIGGRISAALKSKRFGFLVRLRNS